MRRDVIHTPTVDDGEATCADCGCWLPLDETVTALGTPNGALLDVGGFGAFCVTVKGTLGREAILCSHPSVTAQNNEIVVAPCPDCQDYRKVAGRNTLDCDTCGNTGMIAIIPEAGDLGNSQIVKVETGAPSEEQLAAEGLTVERIPAATEFEKQVNRGGFANWLGMRALVREEMTD